MGERSLDAFHEAAADMGPAVDQPPGTIVARDLGHRVVGLGGIALQEPAPIPGEEVQRMLLAPTGRVMKHYDGRAATAMAAIIGYHGPEIAALRGFVPRIQHRRAGLVDEDAIGPAQMGLHVPDDRQQVEAGAADPVAERSAVEIDALPLEDPGLAIERQMVAELRDHDPGDELLRGQPAGHDMLGGMGLRHALRAAPAGVFRAPRHHPPGTGPG